MHRSSLYVGVLCVVLQEHGVKHEAGDGLCDGINKVNYRTHVNSASSVEEVCCRNTAYIAAVRCLWQAVVDDSQPR